MVLTNDVTAIDAVTGEDANMAADVNSSTRSIDNWHASSNPKPAEIPAAIDQARYRPSRARTRPRRRAIRPAPPPTNELTIAQGSPTTL